MIQYHHLSLDNLLYISEHFLRSGLLGRCMKFVALPLLLRTFLSFRLYSLISPQVELYLGSMAFHLEYILFWKMLYLMEHFLPFDSEIVGIRLSIVVLSEEFHFSWHSCMS